MSISLQKGQKVNLAKDKAGLAKVIIGLGWDEVQQTDDHFGKSCIVFGQIDFLSFL